MSYRCMELLCLGGLLSLVAHSLAIPVKQQEVEHLLQFHPINSEQYNGILRMTGLAEGRQLPGMSHGSFMPPVTPPSGLFSPDLQLNYTKGSENMQQMMQNQKYWRDTIRKSLNWVMTNVGYSDKSLQKSYPMCVVQFPDLPDLFQKDIDMSIAEADNIAKGSTKQDVVEEAPHVRPQPLVVCVVIMSDGRENPMMEHHGLSSIAVSSKPTPDRYTTQKRQQRPTAQKKRKQPERYPTRQEPKRKNVRRRPEYPSSPYAVSSYYSGYPYASSRPSYSSFHGNTASDLAAPPSSGRRSAESYYYGPGHQDYDSGEHDDSSHDYEDEYPHSPYEAYGGYPYPYGAHTADPYSSPYYYGAPSGDPYAGSYANPYGQHQYYPDDSSEDSAEHSEDSYSGENYEPDEYDSYEE